MPHESSRPKCLACLWRGLAVWVLLVVTFGIFGYDQRTAYNFSLAITQPFASDSLAPAAATAGESTTPAGESPAAAATEADEAPGEDMSDETTSPVAEVSDTTTTTTTTTTTQVWDSTELFPDPEAPRLFVKEHIDGAGHRMKTIITGIAVAMKNKMKFGGVVPVPNTVTEHGHDFRKVVDGFFGVNASGRLFTQHPATFDHTFPSLAAMEEKRTSFDKQSSVYCPNVGEWEMVPVPASRYFSPGLRAALRRQLEQRSLDFAPGRVAVALHLRRGDLNKGEYRATSNKYYYGLLKRARAALPEADVHVWSSTANIMAHPDKPKWKSSDFDGFRKRGARVHLDDKNVLDPWAHMSRAHVLIMSKSSFSMVPGMLNPNCVIYEGSVSKPLDGWVNGWDKRASYDADLSACFTRAQAAAGLPPTEAAQQPPAASKQPLPEEEEEEPREPPKTVEPKEPPKKEEPQEPPKKEEPREPPKKEEPTVSGAFPSDEAEIRRRIAEVARARAGLYKDKLSRPEFAHTVLVTGANLAYFPFYKNWRCFAEKHGLDWAVIANDEEAYKRLGPDRAMPVLGERISGMVGWGNVKLDSVGRNKMFMVLQIMNLTGLDVLFSDADNVFRKDPFQPGASIGDLIRSGKYDYIYEEELQKAPSKGHKAPGDGGNTGFFYAAGSRKPRRIQAFFAGVVDRVDTIRREHHNSGADQPIFWDVMNELRRSKGSAEDRLGFRCAAMCGQQPTCAASAEGTIEYCAMDPFMHPTGWEEPPASSVSYHANYATNEAKIAKLKKAKLWNPSSCEAQKEGD